MSNTNNAASDLAKRLAEPFAESEVEFKPQAVKGNRALAICYVDARAIMDRLDSVLGVGSWQTSYRELPDGVVCRLRIRVGQEWCEHEDVGGFSDQPDKGDRLKAGYSDALKRAAVHIGIGRYLYRLPSQWCDYDPTKRSFVKTPKLPSWALPTGTKTAAQTDPGPRPSPVEPLPDKTKLPSKLKPDSRPQKLMTDAIDREREMVGAGLIGPSELMAALDDFAEVEGFHADYRQWDENNVKDARKFLAKWVAEHQPAAAK